MPNPSIARSTTHWRKLETTSWTVACERVVLSERFDNGCSQWKPLDGSSVVLATRDDPAQLGEPPELVTTTLERKAPQGFMRQFPAVTLDRPGDQIVLQFDARHACGEFVDQGFRFGLLPSPEVDHQGCFASVDLGRSTTRVSASIQRSQPKKTGDWWDGPRVASDDNDSRPDPLMFTRDRNFTYTWSMTRNRQGHLKVELTNHLAAAAGALRGTIKSDVPFHFDTVVFASAVPATEFALDNVRITKQKRPERGRSGDTGRIGFYCDAGVGRSYRSVLQTLSQIDGVTLSKLLSAQDICEGQLSEIDVLIHPGGTGGGQGRHLGEQGREEIRRFVRRGGGYLGICAGAYLASSHYEWSLHILDAAVLDTQHWDRGTGVVEIELTEKGKKLLDSNGSRLKIFYGQGPLLAPGERPDLDDYATIARFKTEIEKNGAPEGVMIDATAIASGRYGNGKVFCFSPHPELTTGLGHLVQSAIEHLTYKQEIRR
ncbi:MAG: BPL-N domain-containing protein [Planctomycetota bacterium]